MQLQIPELQDRVLGATYYVSGFIVVAAAALVYIWRLSNGPNLDKIPTIGSSTWLGSWWDALRHLISAGDDIREGYYKYKDAPFKISTFDRWLVILSSRRYVEEICRFRDDEFSFLEAVGDIFKVNLTLGHDMLFNPYHIPIVRSKLGRNLGTVFADMKDEIDTAFDDILDLDGHEWKSLPASSTVQEVITRTTNRVFVGLPLCRDREWIDLVMRFTLDALKAAGILSLLPDFTAPVVVPLMTNIRGSIRRAAERLSPIVEARRKHVEAYGTSWDDSPNTLLSYFMEGPEGAQRTVSNLASRALGVSFAAVHTSTNSFTQILYNLVANPQYIQPLREEVESIVREEGWSKEAVEKMHKVDSFVKETLRTGGVGTVSLLRKALKDVTFSDGTVIPKGTLVVVAAQAVHQNEECYQNAETFNPFRFAKMRTEDSSDVKFRFATTSPEYLIFGHGRHACPGRFFAANMISTMLAHFVITYDIKLEDNAPPPQNWQLGISIMANPVARVAFRRRVR